MTTTIGSLDLNAFNDLYSDSNQYFWFEGNASATYGAGVHITLSPDTSFVANPSGQNILINTDGISIRNGLLPMMTLDNDSLDFNVVDTTSNTYTKVASFGAETRIGRDEQGYASLMLSPGDFYLLSKENTILFETGVPSGETSSGNIHIYADSYYAGLSFGTYTLDDGDSTTVSGQFLSSVVRGLFVGTTFQTSVILWVVPSGASYGYNYTIIDMQSFVRGTSATRTYEGMSLVYDGVATFTVSGTFTNNSGTTLRLSNTGGNLDGWVTTDDTLVYDTYINGNAFLNKPNGNVYLGLPYKNHFRYSDYDLYNAINSLGWNNDVLVNISFAYDTKTIQYTGATIVDNVLDFTATPLSSTITITSSNTSVVSGGGVRYYEDPTSPLYYIYINILSTGTTTITASMTVGGETYSDSCVVTVT